MEGYLRAASQISRLAVGDRNATATSATYKLGRNMSQMRHVEGAPMGTRGGISVVHIFPADGDYVFKVSLHNEPLGGIYGRTSMSTLNINEQIEVSINGERAALIQLNPRMSETDPKNNLEPGHAADSRQRRSAARVRRIHQPLRRTGRRSAGPAREHARRRENRASASPRCRTCADFSIIGPSKRHRHFGHAEPPQDLHVPADRRRTRKSRARATSSSASRAGVSRGRHGRRSAAT